MVLGHDLGVGQRTQDVRISEDVSFDTMLLSKTTLKGLKKAGFLRPSPVQLHGIPLGKCGFDLLLESKSGTGKTAVFTVISLEKLDLNNGVQTIILAPTREIASQISAVITEIGSQYKGLNVVVVMGGLPVKDDIEKFKENVHIVVGSPGRLRHLVQDKHIDLSAVRLLVLDEADKLMEKSFLPDINYIFSLLPKQKQIIMSSATYSEDTKTFIAKYVQKAQHICPDSNSVLLGITQKVVIVPHNSNIVKQTKHRYEVLKKILNSKQFKQCLIFCNYQVRVGELHRMLARDKWPAEQLYGQQEQTDRLDALKTLQEYKCRILVSTDLAARGIDASNVDVVINFEPPFEWQTYLHRIGRAGRYGSYGTAISILSDGKEKTKFIEILAHTKINFNLCDLWNDEPFNLTVTNDTFKKDDNTHVTVSPNNAVLQNGHKSEDALWRALTMGSSLEHHDDAKPEIYSFEELCDSFKIQNESNFETFSDLMNSYKVNGDKKMYTENIEFKHVTVTALTVDVAKYWDSIDDSCSQENSLPKLKSKSIITNIINGESNSAKESNGYERHLTEEMEKESLGKYLSESPEMASPKMFNYLETERNTSNKINLHKDLGKQSNENKIDPIKQALVDMGLPTAFGKNNHDKKHCRTKKYHNVTNKVASSETAIDVNKQTIAGISPIKINESKTENYINQMEVGEFATVLEKNKLDSHNVINSYHDTYHDETSTDHEIEINPVKPALVNTGLPTTLGKIKDNKVPPIHTYYHSNDKASTHIRKTNVQQTKQKPSQLKDTYRKKLGNTGSSKTFTRKSYEQNCSSTTVLESDQSESSSEGSCNDLHINKLRNTTYTYNKTSCHQYKKHSSTMERNREQQFDNWYRQLKYQTQAIQYALYIEELRKL